MFQITLYCGYESICIGILYLLDCILECLNGGVLNNETCTCDCALTDYTEDRCESMCVRGTCMWFDVVYRYK